jgi:uncharacterized protein (TIGR03118 family)
MHKLSSLARQAFPATLFAVSFALAAPSHADSTAYQVTKLVSDVAGTAANTDTQLKNPWGVAFNPNGFVWVADNHAGASTLYDGNGVKQSLVVTIPAASGTGTGSPTGITFNGTNDFNVVTNAPPSNANPTPARFIFASEDGAITAWAPGITVAILKVTADASYKGIAIAGNGNANLLFAADFRGGKIDVYTTAFAPTTVPGGFADPRLPKGYKPFNVMNIKGNLYVAYAFAEEGSDEETAGRGLGIVNVFDADGFLLKRLISHGQLNAPWGMALAPAGFGKFSNMLLVGNFGDGTIHAYDPSDGGHRGRLRDGNADLKLDGLWGIAFGPGVQHQPTDTMFAAAGIGDEEHGLYARIEATPGR